MSIYLKNKDTLQFNESGTGGSGLIAQVGRIGGKQIESIENE